MNVYTALFDSMLECCDRIGSRLGMLYTMTMLALGLCLCLNLLSIIDLLWAARLLPNPYAGAAGLHPQHYIYGLLYGCLALNAVLVRMMFRADRRAAPGGADERCRPQSRAPAAPWIRLPGTAYILGSTGLFLVTVTAGLLG